MAFSRFPDSVQCVDWWREKKLFKKTLWRDGWWEPATVLPPAEVLGVPLEMSCPEFIENGDSCS